MMLPHSTAASQPVRPIVVERVSERARAVAARAVAASARHLCDFRRTAKHRAEVTIILSIYVA